VFIALLVLVATLVTQAAPAGVNKQAETLTVVGATQPAQIPEWLVWEYSFTLVKQWQGKDSGFTHDLRESLSPGEFELLEKEALAHAAREARREVRGARLMEKYPNTATADPAILAKANDEAFAIDLEYRREILASRDRLLQALSTESQSALMNWVVENKVAITAYVHKSDLIRWRSPE
jgi:hypothetical protein